MCFIFTSRSRFIGEKRMSAVVDAGKCTACGTCKDECAVEAITVKDVAVVDKEKCIDCGACIDACPEGAITLE